MATTGHFDWASFFALFSNDKGLRCRLNIPWTLLLDAQGGVSSTWVTNKEGHVVRQPPSAASSWAAVAKALITDSRQQQPLQGDLTRPVAIARAADGLPHLFNTEQLTALATTLAPLGAFPEHQRVFAEQQLAAVQWDHTVPPAVLQSYVIPSDNLRFITTYINTGHSLSCHSFPRLYSSRYQLMLGDPEAAAATGLALGQEQLEEQQRQQREVAAAPVDSELKAALRQQTHHLVKYIQRAHGLTLKGLVAEYVVDATSGSVVLLAVLRLEWASNSGGAGGGPYQQANLLMEPTEEPPFLMESGEPFGLASATAAAAGGPGWEGVGPRLLVDPPTQCTSPVGAATASRPHTSTGSRRGSPVTIGVGGSTTSSLTKFPGGSQQAATSSCTAGLSNSWPSFHHQAALSTDPLRSTGGHGTAAAAAAVRVSQTGPVAAAAAAAGGVEGEVGCLAGGAGGTSPLRCVSASGRLLASSGRNSSPMRPNSSSSSSSPTKPPWGARTSGCSVWAAATATRPLSGTINSTTAAAAAAGGGGTSTLGPLTTKAAGTLSGRSTSRQKTTAAGEGVLTGLPAHAAHAVLRSAPGLTQLMAHEVEALQEEVQFQHRMAEASAAKVRQLEHDSAVTAAAFESQVTELSDALATTTAQLADMTQERDALTLRVTELTEQVSSLSATRQSLEGLLQQERGTTLSTLREYQERDAAATARIAQLEGDCTRLEQQLKEEALSASILKRQLVQWQDVTARGTEDAWGSSSSDATLTQVLAAIKPLLQSQSNPSGEGYALQKVIGGHHTELRAVFLHYAQLESSLGQHWPPMMTYPQWLMFAKDTKISDPRAGARIRSSAHDRMLTIEQLEKLFKSYAAADTSSTSDNQPVLGYEAFLATLVAAAQALKRPDQVHLSEMVRDLLQKYVARAQKVVPPGIKAGAVHALSRVKRVPAGVTRPATSGTRRGSQSDPLGTTTLGATGGSGVNTAGPSRTTSVTLARAATLSGGGRAKSGRLSNAGAGGGSQGAHRSSTAGRGTVEGLAVDRATTQQHQQQGSVPVDESWAELEHLAAGGPHPAAAAPAPAAAPTAAAAPGGGGGGSTRPSSARPGLRPASAQLSRPVGAATSSRQAPTTTAAAAEMAAFGSSHDVGTAAGAGGSQQLSHPWSNESNNGQPPEGQLAASSSGEVYSSIPGTNSSSSGAEQDGEGAGGAAVGGMFAGDASQESGGHKVPGGGDADMDLEQLQLYQLLAAARGGSGAEDEPEQQHQQQQEEEQRQEEGEEEQQQQQEQEEEQEEQQPVEPEP